MFCLAIRDNTSSRPRLNLSDPKLVGVTITGLLDSQNVVNLSARAHELRSANRKCDPKVPLIPSSNCLTSSILV
jgi:hypothetical protein